MCYYAEISYIIHEAYSFAKIVCKNTIKLGAPDRMFGKWEDGSWEPESQGTREIENLKAYKPLIF
jgi:hypothetical protein